MGHNNHDSHGHDDLGLGHILPKKVYWSVFWALMVLTVITVVVAKVKAFDFGSLNLVIAMAIASVKASLVALYFMHLKYENPILWIYVAFPLILLGLLLGGVFIDQPFR
jgi:cytochrome c oxidase subunit 4